MWNEINTNTQSEKEGLVLFAHGARNAQWAEPFLRLKAMTQLSAPHVKVELAFLELMSPNLTDLVYDLIIDGILKITVVPIFLGQGGHVVRDLPKIVDELKLQYPDVSFELVGAVGEDERVLKSISNYCLQSL